MKTETVIMNDEKLIVSVDSSTIWHLEKMYLDAIEIRCSFRVGQFLICFGMLYRCTVNVRHATFLDRLIPVHNPKHKHNDQLSSTHQFSYCLVKFSNLIITYKI